MYYRLPIRREFLFFVLGLALSPGAIAQGQSPGVPTKYAKEKYRVQFDPKGWTSWSRFSGDGLLAPVGDELGRIRIWDVTAGKVKNLVVGGSKASHAALTSDGKTVFAQVWNTNSGIVAWEIPTGRELFRLDPAYSFALDPTGKYIAVVAYVGPPGNGFGGKRAPNPFDKNRPLVAIQFRDAKTGELIRQSPGLDYFDFEQMVFSPNGKRLAAMGTGLIKVGRATMFWDVESGKVDEGVESQFGVFTTICFSPCGKFLACGSERGTVKIWNLETGKESLNIKCDERVHQLAYHPNGNWLAVSQASGGKRISIREIANGNELFSLKCDGVWLGMSFNAAGTLLTAVTSDCIQAWELALPK